MATDFGVFPGEKFAWKNPLPGFGTQYHNPSPLEYLSGQDDCSNDKSIQLLVHLLNLLTLGMQQVRWFFACCLFPASTFWVIELYHILYISRFRMISSYPGHISLHLGLMTMCWMALQLRLLVPVSGLVLNFDFFQSPFGLAVWDYGLL